MLTRLYINQILTERKEQIDQRLQELKFTNPHTDLLYLDDDQKLGVEQTKQIREFLSLKPFQADKRVVVIVSAQNLTIDAQNSLLKTIEEPPGRSVIILGADFEHSLLPTVLSRCEMVRGDGGDSNLEHKISEKNLKLIGSLPEMSIEERFGVIEKVEDKEQFLKDLVQIYQKQMKNDPKLVKVVNELMDAQRWFEANGNVRAILEYIALIIPQKNYILK